MGKYGVWVKVCLYLFDVISDWVNGGLMLGSHLWWGALTIAMSWLPPFLMALEGAMSWAVGWCKTTEEGLSWSFKNICSKVGGFLFALIVLGIYPLLLPLLM